MSAALLAVGAFVVMEGVSYAAHRWVMHGLGRAWHRSHHRPSTGGFEENDLFPVCFSVVAIALFVLGSTGITAAWWTALGVSAYGACYLFVHEVYIHRRVRVPVPRLAYLEWLREAHRAHHVSGHEPYGMLLPLVRGPAGSADRDALDRSGNGRARERA